MTEEKRQTQYELIFDAFKDQPKTMKMVDQQTGIMRENICRYVGEMKKKGLIKVVREGRCPVTLHRASFYTTNPALFPAELQLSLF